MITRSFRSISVRKNCVSHVKHRSTPDEARQWIEQAGSDFRAVCGLAGVDADAMLAGRVGPIHLAGPGTRKRRTAQPEGKAA